MGFINNKFWSCGINKFVTFVVLSMFCVVRLRVQCYELSYYDVPDIITAVSISEYDGSIFIGHGNNVTHLANNMTSPGNNVTHLDFKMTSLGTYAIGEREIYVVDKWNDLIPEKNKVVIISILKHDDLTTKVLACVELGNPNCSVVDFQHETIHNVTGELNSYGGSSSFIAGKTESYVTLSKDVDLTSRVKKLEDAYVFSIHNIFFNNQNHYQTNFVELFKPHAPFKVNILYSFTFRQVSYFVSEYIPYFKANSSFALFVLSNYFHPDGIKLTEIPIHVDRDFQIVKAYLLNTSADDAMLYLLCQKRSTDTMTTVVYRVSMATIEEKTEQTYREYVNQNSGFFPYWLNAILPGQKILEVRTSTSVTALFSQIFFHINFLPFFFKNALFIIFYTDVAGLN